jgi:hypothetical protein
MRTSKRRLPAAAASATAPLAASASSTVSSMAIILELRFGLGWAGWLAFVVIVLASPVIK